jgi:3-methyladenine DNA glycosylase AlkD
MASRPVRSCSFVSWFELTLSDLKKELAAASDSERARSSAWFFKTGKGQYGHGDHFIGITVPVQRKIARRYTHLPLQEVARLLDSRTHEHRLTALEILVAQYERGDATQKQAIFDFYLKSTGRVNNWDLVDGSAPGIVGAHLVARSRRVLYRLAKSKNLWERRIAMVSTMTLIRSRDLTDAFAIAKILLKDEHDLIHKAAGWMLREAGKRSQEGLVRFLKRNYSAMPRTALRYAIERFPMAERKRMLAGRFS